jgi:DNA-binding CsgD family transcriptional regulator
MDDPAVALSQLLHAMRSDIYSALSGMGMPAYVIDRQGTIRWLNSAGLALWPNAVNRKFSTVIAPEELRHAREQFARKVIGETDATEYATALLDADGRRMDVDVSSVALRADGAVVGVFGVVTPARAQNLVNPPRKAIELTPRQRQVLRLLGDGRTTVTIASDLGIADETARNHIKAVLRAFNARSRLEAVVAARREGLL